MTSASNAIITKARAMYGRMLSPAQYDELLRCQNVQEICAYLKDRTTYGSIFANVQPSTIHRGQLETLLNKDMFYQYTRLIRYAQDDKGVYEYAIFSLEVKVLLACLRHIISPSYNELVSHLSDFIQSYATFNIYDAAKAKTVDELILVVEHTPYAEVLHRCKQLYPQDGPSVRYTVYEVALRTWYFTTMYKRIRASAKGKARKDLEDMLSLRAEMMNINAIYRLKTYFHIDDAYVRSAMLPFHKNLSPKQLEQLVQAQDSETFLRLLGKTRYGKLLDLEDPFIESSTDNLRFQFNRNRLRFSTDPQVVFISFMTLRGMETDNIIRIVEGVHYGLPPEQIEKLLYHC